MEEQEDFDALFEQQKKRDSETASRGRQAICRELPQMIQSYGFELGHEIHHNEPMHLRTESRFWRSITPVEKVHEYGGTLVKFLLMREVFSETEGAKHYCFVISYVEFPNLPQPQTKLDVECFLQEGSVTRTDNPFVQIMLRP